MNRLPEPPRSTISPDLATMTPADHEMWLSGYSAGIGIGISIGRQQRDDEEQAAWTKMAAFVRRMASEPTYSQLCELRGEHERAAVAREQEARLGVGVAR